MPAHPVLLTIGCALAGWAGVFIFASLITWELVSLSLKIGAVVGLVWAVRNWLL